MKRILAVCIVLLLAVCLTGCGETLNQADETAPPTLTPGIVSTPAPASAVEFTAKIIRTNGWVENAIYPRITIIHTLSELEAYVEANREVYALGDFILAIGEFDDAYFEENALILILAQENSGSKELTVESVNKYDDYTEVNLAITNPEVQTADMAQWHIIIALKDEDVVNDDVIIFEW